MSFKFLFRLVLSAFLAVALVLLVLVGALFFFEQPVPQTLLRRVLAAVSTERILVVADSATVRLTQGIKLFNLRVYDRKKHHLKLKDPVQTLFTAARVDLDLDFTHLPWSRARLLRGVTLVEAHYPRLPEGYYIPDSIEFPGQPDFRETNEPVQLELPDLEPFRLTLIRCDILAITPKFAEFAQVSVRPGSLRAEGLHLQWPDTDTLMTLNGFVELDLAAQLVKGEVRGLARQHNIRPMLVAIDILNALPFIDAFTEVEPPVPAVCQFDVNLRNGDLHIFLDLHPKGGRHHGVPLRTVDGTVDLNVFVRDTFQNARIVVGPLRARLADDTRLDGTVVYENTNDVATCSFDIQTATALANVLAIGDVMRDGTLDCLEVTNGVPRVTLKGRVAVDSRHAARLNDLVGTIAFDAGALFGIPLRDAASGFRVKGTDVFFTDAHAATVRGGRLAGVARIAVPESRRDLANYAVSVACTNTPLADLAEVFSFDLGDRHGVVDGRVVLTGPLETNALARLAAGGRVVCRDGHLAQMKLFAGLTDYLAKNVPGVGGLVNQSRAALDFSLTNGVFTTTNLVIEGGVFSIQAAGRYDLVKDDLDFAAKLTFTRNDGWIAKLATPITWPFGELSKMFFYFRIRGPIDRPTWSYNKNPLDRFPFDRLNLDRLRFDAFKLDAFKLDSLKFDSLKFDRLPLNPFRKAEPKKSAPRTR